MVIHSSSPNGQPGEYGCHLVLRNWGDSSQTSVLRFEFPVSFAEGDGVDDAVATLIDLAGRVPFSCGTAGFGFSYWHADRFAADQVRALLPGYLGFDHSDRWCNTMAGKTPTASWLTFLSTELAEHLDLSALAQSSPSSRVSEMPKGVCVRASRRPPVGELARGAGDVGALPSLARWMKPLRFTAPSFAGSRVELDVPGWLARFDDLPDGSWDNRE